MFVVTGFIIQDLRLELLESLFNFCIVQTLPEFASIIYRNFCMSKISDYELVLYLRDAARGKHHQKWFLLHDSVTEHQSVLAKVFFVKNNMTTLENPPYYPHLAPADCYLYPRLKLALASVMLPTLLRMQRKSWKGFYKVSSMNVSNSFSVADRNQ
jgi:hypothetical protein